MRNARNGAGQGWCFCSVDVACSACGVRNMVGTGSRLVARSAPAIRNTTGRRNRFGVADLLCSICSICSAVFGGERQVTTPGVAESLREVAPDRRLLALDADLGGRHAEGRPVEHTHGPHVQTDWLPMTLHQRQLRIARISAASSRALAPAGASA